jgi:hypothetical protein
MQDKRSLWLLAPLAFALLGWAGAVAPAGPTPREGKLTADQVARAEKVARKKLEELKGSYGSVQFIRDASLEKVFPRHAFFFVLFRQYPVGRVPPAGLKVSNVFTVGADGKVQVLTDPRQLEKFFRAQLPAGTGDAQLKEETRAWLSLAQQFSQDGFYTFRLVEDSLKVTRVKGGKRGSGTVVAMKGGSGTLSATLTFNESGRLAEVSAITKLRPGPRPVCQATRLLDRDAVVRRMAEQDLLIMGRAAKPYLDEQRAKAPPELRRAIDRLWQRICAEDR